MGNHSDTGELLEEARTVAVTERNVSFGDTLVDEFGNTVSLDQPTDEAHGKSKLTNPTKLKDASGREVQFIRNEIPKEDRPLTQKQFEAMQAKRKKNKTS
jgi:hypothetical protein